MTPAQRIEAVDVSKLSDAQRYSMLNYLLASLAVIVAKGPTALNVADAPERARHWGSLSK